MAQPPNSQRRSAPPSQRSDVKAPASYTPHFSRGGEGKLSQPEHATRIEEAFSSDAERRWRQGRLRRALNSLTLLIALLAGAAYGYSRYSRYSHSQARKAQAAKILHRKAPPAVPKRAPKDAK